jgi:dUTP pyrophosphatase
METVHIKNYRMDEDVKLPVRLHPWDACWDIHSNAEMIIQPGEKILVPTGLIVGLIPGWELQIRPRSSWSIRYGVTVLNTPGTIDAGYRDEVKVILYNTSSKPFLISKGARIAQMALKPVYEMNIIEVETEELLGDSVRGKGGFGSTGE